MRRNRRFGSWELTRMNLQLLANWFWTMLVLFFNRYLVKVEIIQGNMTRCWKQSRMLLTGAETEPLLFALPPRLYSDWTAASFSHRDPIDKFAFAVRHKRHICISFHIEPQTQKWTFASHTHARSHSRYIYSTFVVLYVWIFGLLISPFHLHNNYGAHTHIAPHVPVYIECSGYNIIIYWFTKLTDNNKLHLHMKWMQTPSAIDSSTFYPHR